MIERITVFMDLEFTGLHQKTTPISIGLVTINGDRFYAEFNDYDKTQVDQWIQDNVIKHLRYNDVEETEIYYYRNNNEKYNMNFKSNSETIKKELKKWLEQFDQVEIWSDCLAYDWVVFCQIFDHAFNIPSNVYYIPFDISTLFKIKGIDPDISRKEFSGIENNQHNSLDDATVIKACYEKLIKPDYIHCEYKDTKCDIDQYNETKCYDCINSNCKYMKFYSLNTLQKGDEYNERFKK